MVDSTNTLRLLILVTFIPNSFAVQKDWGRIKREIHRVHTKVHHLQTKYEQLTFNVKPPTINTNVFQEMIKLPREATDPHIRMSIQLASIRKRVQDYVNITTWLYMRQSHLLKTTLFLKNNSVKRSMIKSKTLQVEVIHLILQLVHSFKHLTVRLESMGASKSSKTATIFDKVELRKDLKESYKWIKRNTHHVTLLKSKHRAKRQIEDFLLIAVIEKFVVGLETWVKQK